MRQILILIVVILVISPLTVFGQAYIQSDYMLSSKFKQKEVEGMLGSGSMIKLSGGFTLPFYTKKSHLGQASSWFTSLNGSYTTFSNKGLASQYNPREVANLTLSLGYMGPLSKKWSMIAMLGGGVFAEPSHVSWKSVLINGGAIFIYRVNKTLSLGAGAGVTNTYGVPIAMPMIYLKFNVVGKYEFKIDLFTKVEIAGISKFGKRFELKLTGVEMDGISAVMKKDNKSMIYSSSLVRSYIMPEFKLGKHGILFSGVGAVWARTSKMSERSIKSFWKSFKENSDEYYFKPSGYFTVGIRCGF